MLSLRDHVLYVIFLHLQTSGLFSSVNKTKIFKKCTAKSFCPNLTCKNFSKSKHIVWAGYLNSPRIQEFSLKFKMYFWNHWIQTQEVPWGGLNENSYIFKFLYIWKYKFHHLEYTNETACYDISKLLYFAMELLNHSIVKKYIKQAALVKRNATEIFSVGFCLRIKYSSHERSPECSFLTQN